MKRINPDGAKGTQDILPTEALVKKQLMQIISKTAEHHGFSYIETPILENMETLKSAESDFRVFYALTGEDDAWDTGLRYDLTVPLARIVSKYGSDLPKPFKRYQYGEVFRGEKPQKGRYRHFTQFDLDIVGTDSLDADITCFMIARDTFDKLTLGSKSTLHINSRVFFTALQEVLGISNDTLTELVKLFDKSEKISLDEFKAELAVLIADTAAQDICSALSQITPSSSYEAMLTVVASSSHHEQLLQEFTQVKTLLDNQKSETAYVFNPMIARGFGYYTGFVCEMKVEGFSFSVLGGGRYDNLTEKFSPQNFPATGISFGVDRVLLVLNELGISLSPTQTKRVVIGYLKSTTQAYAYSILGTLQSLSDITSAELYLGTTKDPRSILTYALSKDATHMILVGEDEQSNGNVTIKNLTTKQQETISVDILASYFSE